MRCVRCGERLVYWDEQDEHLACLGCGWHDYRPSEWAVKSAEAGVVEREPAHTAERPPEPKKVPSVTQQELAYRKQMRRIMEDARKAARTEAK